MLFVVGCVSASVLVYVVFRPADSVAALDAPSTHGEFTLRTACLPASQPATRLTSVFCFLFAGFLSSESSGSSGSSGREVVRGDVAVVNVEMPKVSRLSAVV